MSGENDAIESTEYTVGWVCALPLEMAAARGMLDEIHPDPSHRDPHDSNSYIFGKIRGHNIVIACLPAGVYGTNPAATVANNLLRSFKSIRFGLMVGIGGGAPSPQHDIRLGDAVISQPSKEFGGIVQHDRGKITSQGGFERTGSQNAPPTLLLTALSRLQTTHMAEDSQVPDFLAQLIEKSPKRMKSEFKYQGASNDRLYQADYDHVKPEHPTCDECDKTKIVRRVDRDDTDPYFHYGIIASGNQVIKDGETRQRLSREYGALCFEMEAAGLHDFPCLVIRGICDYADSHKNKVWQGYAAATAAAFAKELLLHVAPEQVLKEKKLLTELVSIVKESHETSKQSLTEQRAMKSIMENLPIDLPIVHKARYDSEDVKSSPKCEPGTRIRILGVIEQWANQDVDQPLFWLVGPAGTGKSTIARSVIEILETETLVLAGYFFKRGEQDRNDTNRLFSTIAMQIADALSPFRQSLRDSLEGLDQVAVEKFSLEKQFEKLLWQPFETSKLDMQGQLRIIIIIDALDECERLEHLPRVLGLLAKFCTIPKIRSRVLITSRADPDIREAFEPHKKNRVVRVLEVHREFSEDTKVDIRSFLVARFKDIRSKRSVQKNPWPTAEELDRLVQLSTTPEPLFIYAATLYRFVSDRQRGPIRQLSIWLEQGGKPQLHQIYTPILDQAFSDFDEEEFRQKLQFLAVIALLARPLAPKYITSIVGMDLDDISWWIPRLYAVLHIPPGREQPIELLHKSFSDFLTTDSALNKYRIDTSEIHFALAEKCIQRMKAGLKQDICDIRDPSAERKSINQDRIRRCISADLQYACVYWFYHLECSKRSLSNFTYSFLYEHLLHWIEALALLGQLTDGGFALGRLLEMSQTCEKKDQEFVYFVKDANRAMSFFGSIIDLAPLQVYGSLLFFSPIASKVRQIFWSQRIPRNGHIQGLDTHWDARIQIFDGIYNESIVFSPSGRLLAFGGGQEVIVRDIITGTTTYAIESPFEVVGQMVFSYDSSLLAWTYHRGNIRILNVKTGQVELIFTQKSGVISFLPNSHLIMSLSQDGKMYYWEKKGSAYLETFGWSNMLGGDTFISATFSTCAKLLAVQRPSHYVEVYDLGDRTKLTLNLTLTHDLPSDYLSFSTDSRLLASISRNRCVLTIWDLGTGTEKLSISFKDDIFNIAFSPESRIIATKTFETIQFWDLETGDCITSLQDPSGDEFATDALAFSPNGLLLASPSSLWDTTLRQDSDVSYRHGLRITKVIWSPDGRLVASTSEDETIQIWDAVTGIRRWILKGHKGSVDELLFSSDSHLLASASKDGTLRIWCMNSGVLQNTVMDEWGSISDVTYSLDREMAASISLFSRKTVKLWRAETGTHLRTFEIPKTTVEETDKVLSAIFSPDGRIIAVTTSAASLICICWSTATGEKIQEIRRPFRSGSRIKFSPDSQLIAVEKFTDIDIWRVGSSSRLRTFEFDIDPFDSLPLAFSFDGELVAFAEEGSDVSVWSVSTGAKKYALEGHKACHEAMLFSPDGYMIALASDDDYVRIWKLASQSKPHLVLGYSEKISILDFSPDGRVLVAASPQNVIWLWDTSSGSEIRRISHSEGSIKHIDFLPDELVVSTLFPARTRFWNVWNDMNLQVHRYSLAAITPEDGLKQNECRLSLEHDNLWIWKGSERLLWIPPQYRSSSSDSWASKGSSIFIGSVSGHVIRFQTT